MSEEKISPGYFVQIPEELFKLPGLQPIDWIVYGTVRAFEAKGQRCFASNAWLAKKFGIATATVERSINRLEEKNLLVRVVKAGKGAIKKRFLFATRFTDEWNEPQIEGRTSLKLDNHEPQIEAIIDQDNKSNSNKIRESTPPPDSDSEIPFSIEEIFLTEEEKDFTKDNRFIGAGRRPLRKYPEIWISPLEYRDAIIEMVDCGLELPDSRAKVFKAVQSRLRTKLQAGDSIKAVSPYNWLTSWALREVLQKERDTLYLRNAREKSR